MKRKDITGKRFGRLVAISEVKERKNGLVQWLCACDCGRAKVAYTKTLVNGGTRSCGCLHLEVAKERMKKIVAKKAVPVGHERETNRGYIVMKTSTGWKLKHVNVMEEYLGRCLVGDEIVHHCDDDKKNNNIKNLELMRSCDHTVFHHTGSTRSRATRKRMSVAHINRTNKYGHVGRKLNKEQVVKIKRMLKDRASYSFLAATFGVSKEMIAAINKKRAWRTIC